MAAGEPQRPALSRFFSTGWGTADPLCLPRNPRSCPGCGGALGLAEEVGQLVVHMLNSGAWMPRMNRPPSAVPARASAARFSSCPTRPRSWATPPRSVLVLGDEAQPLPTRPPGRSGRRRRGRCPASRCGGRPTARHRTRDRPGTPGTAAGPGRSRPSVRRCRWSRWGPRAPPRRTGRSRARARRGPQVIGRVVAKRWRSASELRRSTGGRDASGSRGCPAP